MRIRKRPPPPLSLPSLPSPSLSLYVDLPLAPSPSHPLPFTPPPPPTSTSSSLLSYPPSPSPPVPPPPPPPPASLLLDSHQPRCADASHCVPMVPPPISTAVAPKALDDTSVSAQQRREEISEPSTPIPSAFNRNFAETGDNSEMRMPIRKRRSFTRPRPSNLLSVGTDEELQECKAKRLVALEELNQIGTWEAKDLLSWALKLIVPEQGSQELAERITDNCYSKSSKADSIPRLVQLGRAWRSNPHIQELSENIRHVEDQTRQEAKGEKCDRNMINDRHNLRQQEKVRCEKKFTGEKITKRVTFDEQDEGAESRIMAASEINGGGKEVPMKCSRGDGSIARQLERNGDKKLSGHEDFELEQVASDGEAKSSEDIIKMKKKKKKKRRCFKSLHEIVKQDESRQLFQRHEGAYQQHADQLRESSASVCAVAGGFCSDPASFQASCALNTDPTEWRSDLF